MSAPTVSAIPERAGAISVGWISKLLAAAGTPGAARLTSFRAQSLHAGRGVFGELVRLHLRYTGATADTPASVIVKLPSPVAANRARAALFGLYEREV